MAAQYSIHILKGYFKTAYIKHVKMLYVLKISKCFPADYVSYY